MRRITILLTSLALTSLVVGTVAIAAGENGILDEMISTYLDERGASVQLAPPNQLARRYSLDLTGVTPSLADVEATSEMTPEQQFDYFASKGVMPHTGTLTAYAWTNLLRDADHFLFSNSTQFSQVVHIQEFHDELAQVYTADRSFQDFARFALNSQMFLNRFPSGADRANASFFLFLGRDTFSSEVPSGDMWNGWALTNENANVGDADYHVYDYDEARCGTTVNCEAVLWNDVGSTPQAIIDMLVTSELFAEATVDRYWQLLIGTQLPGVDFPIIRTALAQGFMQNAYSVNWLIREIATSSAYTQEMMFR